MSGEDREVGMSDFERRTRALLLESSESLPGAVRSRLTQARHAALAVRSAAPSSSMVRRWVPAGALAGVVLALFVVWVPHGSGTLRVAMSGTQLEDIDLLTDSDAVTLNGDQDVDYDFYEWAAHEANGNSSLVVGS
jgi:hypothetical protein